PAAVPAPAARVPPCAHAGRRADRPVHFGLSLSYCDLCPRLLAGDMMAARRRPRRGDYPRDRRIIIMHLMRLLCLALLVTSSGAMAEYKRHIWEGNLPERFFETFLELYKKDPSALARYPGGLQNISSEQLHRAIAELDTTHFTYMYPMTMRGYDLPRYNGTPIERLSLMAVRGDQMIPIPFQIDEYDRTGLIWIQGHNQAPPEGTPGEFDEFDELVFMFRDGGHKTYLPDQHGKIEGQVLQEIRLDSPRNDPRYIYLVL